MPVSDYVYETRKWKAKLAEKYMLIWNMKKSFVIFQGLVTKNCMIFC